MKIEKKTPLLKKENNINPSSILFHSIALKSFIVKATLGTFV